MTFPRGLITGTAGTSTQRSALRKAATALLTTAVTTGAAALVATAGTAQAATGRTVLPGSAAPATATAALGRVPASQRSTVQVWLRGDVAGAARFADAVSTPGSASFHDYLSPAAYTARFGASPAATAAVRSWLSREGFSNVTADAQRNYVTATGPVSAVQRAFHVTMKRYRTPTAEGTPTVIESNDRNVSLPTAVAGDVLGVTGLNSSRPQAFHTATHASPAVARPSCSRYWGQHVARLPRRFSGLGKGSLPVCGYSARQLRAAYGMSMANTGRGQTVALIEVGRPYKMVKTLRHYAAVNQLPAPKPTQYKNLVIGRGGACRNYFDIEEQLDSEATYAMAPEANQLLVSGDGCNAKLGGVQALFDAQLAVLNGNGHWPLASIESNSWGITGGETYPRIYLRTAHSIMLRAADEGVTMLVSSGDGPGNTVPASDPYALAVGGTTIGISQHQHRIFETGWSNHDAIWNQGKWYDYGIGRDAAGGGTSLLYAEPHYQKGVVPASMTHVGVGNHTDRAVPDISADADPNTGIAQIDTVRTKKGDRYRRFVDGGTSLACPLIAGIIAVAQQGQPTGFGFANPAVYSLAGSPALHDTRPVTRSAPQRNRDAYSPATKDHPAFVSVLDSELRAYTDQVTATGYDTMTGVGTPNGQRFITALRRSEPAT